ncbi:helix-turn-helix domain-containing protein [Thaumasiovibrio subtropicus]|uniref:helix-turn-helix domain-containing protein n=1 Tax=Thaumasiovibrio subtropicus TaxID=1891207 RepID=UPI000B34EBD2|nr:helix-turn-helix transcriptional regulator [Thaumasiovibrio subtropicus]
MSDEILKLFGQRVKHLRKQANLSQEVLAALSGLDRTYISGIERGRRNVGLINLVKIAKALNVSAEQLLVFEEKND